MTIYYSNSFKNSASLETIMPGEEKRSANLWKLCALMPSENKVVSLLNDIPETMPERYFN
jgi:hypothetical protein